MKPVKPSIPGDHSASDALSDRVLLRIATEHARVGLVVIDRDRRFLYANDAYYRILGLPDVSLAGRSIQEVFASVYDDQVRAHLDRAFAGHHVSYHLRMTSVSGENHYSVVYEPSLSDGVVTEVTIVLTDVTAYQRAQEELAVQRDRAQRYLDAAGVILLALDINGCITLINRFGCELLGWTADELVGREFIDTCVPESLRDLTRKRLRTVQLGDDSIVESHVVTRDGDQRLIEWRTSFLRNDAGEITGTLSSGSDITERRLLEKQYHQAQKMEAVGRLAGGVAHDFNNLLTAILGYCQMLLDEIGPTDSHAEDIRQIQKAGESAAGLTRQLLAFSRKQIIEPVMLDINDALGNVQSILERLIGEDVDIVLKLRPDLSLIKVDRGQLEQIVMNLAVNARDAMPNGGTLTIETDTVELDEEYASTHFGVTPGRYVVLVITDTGTGMSQEVQARLFEPFFTTKEVGKGTGLGLATVHGIVARSGGSVGVYSEIGRGTSFRVYFPVREGHAVVPTSAMQITSAAAQGETILVVEDSAALRDLTKRMLEPLGYNVLLAANADEARAAFDDDERIDIILTDVVMPGESGPDLTKRLVETHRNLKVVFMSGYTEDAITQHGVLNRGVAFLNKPFTAESLARKLREVVSSGRADAA